mmetsp:Transcript_5811/g.18940  ORF Transcript_5811/g.18940 Transcript_5811/m.18940 type:complete len:212 (+) Transcript_5811:797-1432(+)
MSASRVLVAVWEDMSTKVGFRRMYGRVMRGDATVRIDDCHVSTSSRSYCEPAWVRSQRDLVRTTHCATGMHGLLATWPATLGNEQPAGPPVVHAAAATHSDTATMVPARMLRELPRREPPCDAPPLAATAPCLPPRRVRAGCTSSATSATSSSACVSSACTRPTLVAMPVRTDDCMRHRTARQMAHSTMQATTMRPTTSVAGSWWSVQYLL